MQPREVLDRRTTPDGQPLELSVEGGHHVIRISGVPLMSSAAHGSEDQMAQVARELRPSDTACQILVGGLGMGFTCRAALDAFGPKARVTVAELLPALVEYNRGPLGPLAGRPLDDPRTTLFEGDVQAPLRRGGWDVVLMDVDNGPDAFTTRGNSGLYERRGVALMAGALKPRGVLVVWSAFASKPFEHALTRSGLKVQTRRVHARTEARKGPKYTLFIAQAPGPGGGGGRSGPRRSSQGRGKSVR